MQLLKRINNFHHSLRFEMFVAYIVISIIPIIAMQSIFYSVSKYYMEKKINTLTTDNLSYIKTDMESDQEYYKEILYRMDADNNVIQNEVNINDGDSFTHESSTIKLRDLFASYADIRDEVSNITFVNKSLNSVFYDKKNMSVDNYFWNSYNNSEKKKIYDDVHDGNRVVILDTKRFYYNNEVNYFYTIGIRAWNIQTGEDLGIILISINESYLQDICNIDVNNETENSVKEYSFVINNNGSIISFDDSDLIGYSIENNARSGYDINRLIKYIPLNNKDGFIVNSVSVADTNWKIVNLVDKSSMFHEINAFRDISLKITILIILLCIGFIFLFSNKFYRSVNNIVDGIKKAKKGDFSTRIKLKGESELVFISKEFNDMVLTINNLVENLKQRNEYIYEISEKKREAEINAIVSQINPHFLYNTLDCINWIAIKNKNYDISQMISSLAHILRYSIRATNEQVTIYEVVEWLRQYLYLHQVRFNNNFKAEFNIADDVLGCKIYKLLLQPIVENAIIHGFKGSTGGKIWL